MAAVSSAFRKPLQVDRLEGIASIHRENKQMKKVLGGTAISTAAAIVALCLPLHDKALAQQSPALSAMDYIEIQQLVNRLNFALDYCTNGGRDFADLFVAGGQFIIDSGNGSPAVRSSHEELVQLASGPDCEARKTPPSAYILHLAESLLIEASADGAKGMSYAIYPSSAGNFFREDVAGQLGIYHDEYVKTPNGWRFQSRRHETNPVIGEVEL
jgi:hypothetical protein